MSTERGTDRSLVERIDALGDVLSQAPSVVFAYLFGSHATGEAGPLSDVDIAVYLNGTTDSFETRLALVDAVSRHVGSERVDVIVLNDAPIALSGRVLQTRQVLLDRDPFLRHRYESSIARQFADFRITERRHFARRFGRG